MKLEVCFFSTESNAEQTFNYPLCFIYTKLDSTENRQLKENAIQIENNQHEFGEIQNLVSVLNGISCSTQEINLK